MAVSISHPTDRPNFSVVTVGSLTLWFSYRTVIAYQDGYTGYPVVRENNWGPTTGKHLNCVSDDKAARLPSDLFEGQLSVVLDRLNVSV